MSCFLSGNSLRRVGRVPVCRSIISLQRVRSFAALRMTKQVGRDDRIKASFQVGYAKGRSIGDGHDQSAPTIVWIYVSIAILVSLALFVISSNAHDDATD